jgi:membrane-associated phospholipid phosphatase
MIQELPMAATRLVAGVSLMCVACLPAVSRAQDLAETPTAPAALAAPAVSFARPAMPRVSDLFKPLAGDFTRLATSRNLGLMTIGTASALGSHAFDGRVAARPWGTGALEESLEPGRFVGDFMVQTGASFATFAIGRLTNKPRIATLGAELFRAQLVAQTTTQALKLATRRVRPDGTRLSFPSGHTSSAFATATVLQSEFGWKAGVPAYAVAAWVGVSRMQADRHFFSDVVAGATIGLLAGRSVTVGHGASRFTLRPAAIPGGIGVSVGRD